MKPEDHIFEQIEGYINHSLDASHRAAFEISLQENMDLAKKVQIHELANEMVIENRLRTANEVLLNHHKSQFGNSPGFKIGLVILLTATSIGTLLYIFNPSKNYNNAVPSHVEKTTPSKGEMHLTTLNDSMGTKILPAKNKVAISENKMIPVGIPNENKQTEEAIIEKEQTDYEVSTQENKPLVPKKELPIIQENKNLTQPEVSQPTTEKCAGIQIYANLGQASPCYGDQNGRLWLNEGKGGTTPYKIQMIDEHNRAVNSQNLGPGKYEVIITDGNGCIGKQSVLVQHKFCDKDYIINPFSGNNLEIPAYHAGGILKIFDRQGNIYATSSVQMEEPAVWNGQSKNGEMNEGLFNFVIEYSDNMIAKGTITIVR